MPIRSFSEKMSGHMVALNSALHIAIEQNCGQDLCCSFEMIGIRFLCECVPVHSWFPNLNGSVVFRCIVFFGIQISNKLHICLCMCLCILAV